MKNNPARKKYNYKSLVLLIVALVAAPFAILGLNNNLHFVKKEADVNYARIAIPLPNSSIDITKPMIVMWAPAKEASSYNLKLLANNGEVPFNKDLPANSYSATIQPSNFPASGGNAQLSLTTVVNGKPTFDTVMIKFPSQTSTINIVSPKAGSEVKGVFEVVSEVTDPDGVASHKLFIDNTGYPIYQIADCPNSTTCKKTLDTNTLPLKEDEKPNYFTIVVESYDKKFNFSRKYIEVHTPKYNEGTQIITINGSAKFRNPAYPPIIRVYVNKNYTNKLIYMNGGTKTVTLDQKLKSGDVLSLGFDNGTVSGPSRNDSKTITITSVYIDNVLAYKENVSGTEAEQVSRFSVLYDRANKETGGFYGTEDWGNLYSGFWDFKGIYKPAGQMNWNGALNILVK